MTFEAAASSAVGTGSLQELERLALFHVRKYGDTNCSRFDSEPTLDKFDPVEVCGCDDRIYEKCPIPFILRPEGSFLSGRFNWFP